MPLPNEESTELPSPVTIEAPEVLQTSEAPIEEAAPLPPPTEETQDVLEEGGEVNPEINFNDFKERRAGVEKPPKSGEQAPKDKSEVAPKPGKQVEQRDLTIFDEGDREIFKRMSNDAYNKVKEIYVERKQLKETTAKLQEQVKSINRNPNGLPETYYSHPQAYVLDPEYNKATHSLNQSVLIKNHYETQLEKIARGEQWQALDADEKGNIYILDQMLEPSENARKQVADQYKQALAWESQYTGKVQQIQQTFKVTHESDIRAIQEQENKYFPDYDKPDHPLRKVQDGFISILPPSFRSNPLAKTLAKTVANNFLFAKENKELKAKLAKYEKVQPKGQNPTAKNFQVGESKDKPKVSFAEMQARRYNQSVGV